MQIEDNLSLARPLKTTAFIRAIVKQRAGARNKKSLNFGVHGFREALEPWTSHKPRLLAGTVEIKSDFYGACLTRTARAPLAKLTLSNGFSSRQKPHQSSFFWEKPTFQHSSNRSRKVSGIEWPNCDFRGACARARERKRARKETFNFVGERAWNAYNHKRRSSCV